MLCTNEQFDYLFHHLILPAKLPGHDDASGSNEAFLITFVLQCLERFAESARSDEATCRLCISAMENMRDARDLNGGLDSASVQNSLKRISAHGLLIRGTNESFCFETFELSPTNKAAMTTKGRLIREFPATAVEVSAEDFCNPSFQEVLTKTLVKMSHQGVSEMQPKVQKAKQMHDEERDTTDPRIVTELLTSFLRGAGSAVEIKAVQKRTREEVSWHNSRSPWRRSPVWLLIRVGLQLTMSRHECGSHDVYKRFMVFLIAQTLELANERSSPSEILHLMMAKISRRICKLGDSHEEEWLQSVKNIVSSASTCLKARWSNIQRRFEKPLDLDALAEFDFRDHLQLFLPEVDKFLATITQRKSQSTKSCLALKGSALTPDPATLPTVDGSVNNDYKSFKLAVVESWVQQNLDRWVQSHIKTESSCHELKKLLESYHLSAQRWYVTRPEGMSRMLLTIGELWMAVDMLAIHHYPLLQEYSPEIPTQIWQALLIHSKRDMKRLYRLETYIIERKQRSEQNPRPSAISSYGLVSSFPVEYFEQSPMLQAKKQAIEAKAQKDRDNKVKEFRELKAKYDSIMREYDESECDQVLQFQGGVEYYVHRQHKCHRCSLPAKAKKLKITPHEWPLPEDELEAQATVFEMDVPEAFAIWRDTTVYFIDNVLGFTSSDSYPRSSYPLATYRSLSTWFSSKRYRVQLLSETKSHGQTHRNQKLIENSCEADVCLNNGLRFRYHDNSRNTLIQQFTPTMTVSDWCIIKLPQRAKAMERFMVRTWDRPDGETPNQAIASQSECPDFLSLGEFKALAVLPYGYRLQWMSILTQLAMPTIDFNKQETAIFLLQMSLQAGPYWSNEMARHAHKRPTELEFGCQMLASLTQCVSRVEQNWESYTSLCSFTCLTTRLLALADKSLFEPILELLTRCRKISYKWLMKLLAKVQDINDRVQRKEFLETALYVALICIETFNIEGKLFQSMLTDSQQAAILVEVAIIIHNNSDLGRSGDDALYSIMFDRFELTMHRARPILVQEVMSKDNDCLDLAIERRWPNFLRESEWSLASDTCHWMKTTTGNLEVHVNILTGELLVNGSPVSRLPREYETHKEYQRLFGTTAINVMPSDLPGMQFCSTSAFQGYTVHLGLQSIGNKDLLVRLCKEDSTLDFIPSRTLEGLLPRHFVEGYVHWRHGNSSTVEFCELNDPWTTGNPKHWYLKEENSNWKLSRYDGSFLTAPSSQLAKHITGIFSRLESPSNIHLIIDPERNNAEIQLPRLQLDFSVKSGESALRSRQFRDMQIDCDQSIATLVGLQSKLVLRDSQDPSSRTVIIPEGKVKFRKEKGHSIENHIDVVVEIGTANRVQGYRLDDLLCRLVANDKVESKLFLAYLHALTSYCLPDPFIKRTGTEQALTILRSAPIRAPAVLSEAAYERLSLLNDLSPGRSFYPECEKVMQNVKWLTDLSYLSQDDRFGKLVREVHQQSCEVQFLFPHQKVPALEDHTSIELADRAILRTSSQRVSGFGAEDFTIKHDVKYEARDRQRQSERSMRAAEMAFRAYRNSCSLAKPISGQLAVHLYQLMCSDSTVKPRSILPKSKIYYDSCWLQGPESFLSSVWCHLHYSYQKSPDWLGRFELMMWMATMSYSADYDAQAVQALLMLTQSQAVASAPLPVEFSYKLSKGYNLRDIQLQDSASDSAISFEASPEANSSERPDETSKVAASRKRGEFKTKKERAVEAFARHLKRQWPTRTPVRPESRDIESYIRIGPAMEDALRKWSHWQKNLEFKKYLEEVVSRLKDIPTEEIQLESEPPRVLISPTKQTSGFVATKNLFSGSGVLINGSAPMLDGLVLRLPRHAQGTKLTGIIDYLDTKAQLNYEHRYLRELRDSLSSLHGYVESELDQDKLADLPNLLHNHLRNCQSYVTDIYDSLLAAASSSISDGTKRTILEDSGSPPRLSPIVFLQQLKLSQWEHLSREWKEILVAYGTAITALQQAKRLIRFQSSHVDLIRELENSGHKSWSPHDYPEWLLLECESEMMIRDVQQQIAQQMINPPDKQNSVMQLNMGEGKSTVIVPIVATALGDGSKLVRVIVAKPQAKQMHQMLTSKLSGLLDRPVYLLPFSRDIKMNPMNANIMQGLMTKCMEEGGVLMVQPEHLLSFQLMELECQLSKRMDVAERMTKTREFFDHSSRDIVDESDENFSVKFELIYTLGQQRPIEHSPDRWTVIQQVMGLIAKVGSEVKSQFPDSLEFDIRHVGRFPRVRILRPDAEEVILSQVIEIICKTGMAGLPLARQPKRIRDAVRHYIFQREPSAADIEAVERSSFWGETTSRNILLLRGLFSGGILAFALGSKRWRVNYGVDQNREKKTKLAVPFRAKDNPTPRSEFSHPDVVIMFTCLSYYYSGLDDEALFSAFDLLTRSDNSNLEYNAWVKSAPTLPTAFRTLEGVNLRDRVQCTTEIFPYIRYSKAAIDYYLCHLVFAKESKEFPHKLSASGWDLGKKKNSPTTGFSGTNDSRYVLPFGVKQLHLPEQKHTNALVLDYLLQPENSIALMPREAKGTTFDSLILLRMVSEMSSNTRVILDVGAQVVDLTNQEFSKQWLASHKNDDRTQAVIFFNDNDEIVVIDHSGKVEDLQTSPFANQLDRCLVFLDEAHTRGTDLKLPPDYRAVVTLGAGLTKDRLVQACMRMRKLGKGQTVVFCIPWEIEQKILQLKGQDDSNHDISVSDVLCWAITETCLDLRRAIPLWLTQGVRFNKQQELWPKFTDHEYFRSQYSVAEKFLEEEGQSLSERYRPQKGPADLSLLLGQVTSSIAEEFKTRCDEFGLTRLRTSSLQEEQERELAPETQHERQVEKMPALKPETHTVSQFLKDWIQDGSFPDDSQSFHAVIKPAFQSLSRTSAASYLDVREFPAIVWATMDFIHTVKEALEGKNYSDSFQRPVQWVLTSQEEGTRCRLVIISPYEAQHCLPLIERSQHVTLRLYSPRLNLGFQPLDHLQLYCVSGRKSGDIIPRDIVTFLNLFAGQLYLSSFEDYKRLCDLLGLAWDVADDAVILGPDGFIALENSGRIINTSGFTKSPTQFLKCLLENIRQDCGVIGKTDMGKIIDGLQLLYEPIILEHALQKIGGLQICSLENQTLDNYDAAMPDFEAFQFFTNKMAQVCDNERGGNSVSALAILQGELGPNYVFGSNYKDENEVESTQDFVRTLLDLVGLNPDSLGTSALQKKVLALMLSFNMPRLGEYLLLLKRSVNSCLDICKRRGDDNGGIMSSFLLQDKLGLLTASDSVIVENLHVLVNKCKFALDTTTVNAEQRSVSDCETLIKAIHALKEKKVIDIISERAKDGEMTRSEPWCNLRHFLGRWVSYRQAAHGVVSAAQRWPDLFRDFEITMVPSSARIRNPIHKSDITSAIIIQHIAAEEKIEESQFGDVLADAKQLGIDDVIQNLQTSRNFRPLVHAEVAVYEYLKKRDIRTENYWNRWNYIGSSKPTCRLCHYFFEALNEKPHVRLSHWNLYHNWRLPDFDENCDTKEVVDKISGRMRDDLKRTLREKIVRRKMRDSNTSSSFPDYLRIESGGSESMVKTDGMAVLDDENPRSLEGAVSVMSLRDGE
ncbi:hypothetical protein F53441_10495 [Fusarium austroafricanum]|uniref:ubiquitinyl hydrolase 1 n=1 Tax=Fusarium austroafricanum TaxID=2364996 RepID=A0A8H4K9M6_9HYPO|nr:hypothetical protein F53441_10495 [Fusarium austroafricanum]